MPTGNSGNGGELPTEKGERAFLSDGRPWSAVWLARRVVAVIAGSIVIALCAARPALAARACALPSVFGLEIEERGATERGGPGLVATGARVPATALVAGDQVRQANGSRVERCAELEHVAGEALAKGLALLLGIERDGAFIAVAARARSDAEVARIADAAAPRGAPEGGSTGGAATAPPAPAAEISRGAPPARGLQAPTQAQPVVPRGETALPSSADAPVALRAQAASAAAALAAIDEAARLSVPLVVYERRVHDAEAATAALGFDSGPAAAAVERFVRDILDYYRTAAEVRRVKLQLLSDQRIDRRAPSAAVMPYFSDSHVPEWVATYPFLHAAVLEAPRGTRMLFPGEVAGRWDPDRALDLLWTQARAGTARLAAWSRGQQ